MRVQPRFQGKAQLRTRLEQVSEWRGKQTVYQRSDIVGSFLFREINKIRVNMKPRLALYIHIYMPAQGIKSFSSNENCHSEGCPSLVTSKLSTIDYFAEAWTVNPLVILFGGKDALLARETFVTDLHHCITVYLCKNVFQICGREGFLEQVPSKICISA